MTKAKNLLRKAHKAMAVGDSERLALYVEKAASLPWDDFEGLVPGVMAAEYLLYLRVSEASETCALDDTSWLAAAEAIVRSDSPARRDIATVLRDISVSEQTSKRERERIKRLLKECPPFELNHNPGDLPHVERVERITALLQALVAYDEAS